MEEIGASTMANGNGIKSLGLTTANIIQICVMLAMGGMAWGALNGAVDHIVEREAEHYTILHDDIREVKDGLSETNSLLQEHLRDYTLHGLEN